MSTEARKQLAKRRRQNRRRTAAKSRGWVRGPRRLVLRVVFFALVLPFALLRQQSRLRCRVAQAREALVQEQFCDLFATRLEEYGSTRDDTDAFGLGSQELAAQAWGEGRFNQEVVAVEVPILDEDGQPTGETATISSGEGLRETSLEKLGSLKGPIPATA